MAIKNIIAQGIGFSPGSTKYIPTYGFDAAPYSRLVAFDAALATRTALTVSLDAALAKRVVSKTGNFAVRSSFDGTARSQSEGWGVGTGGGHGSTAVLTQVTDAAFPVDTTQVGEFASVLNAGDWSYMYVAVPGPYIVGRKYTLQFQAKLVSGASNWTAAIQDGTSTNVVLASTAFVPSAGVTLFEIPFTAAVAGNAPVVFFALGSNTTGTVRITGVNVFDAGSPGYSYSEPLALDYAAVVLADTPAIYHRLGEASGTTALDSSGNGRNGTHSSGGNVPTYGVAGAPVGSTDTAMRYGVGGNTSITTTLHNDSKTLFTGSFSVEAWFNKPVIAGTNFERLVAKAWVANGWLLGYYNATIQFGLGDAGGSQHNANPNQATWDLILPGWHHAVGTYDGANVRLYVDGQLLATTAYSGWTPSTTLAAAIGSGQQADDIDEVALYDGVALSLARIQAHYYAGSYYHTDGQPWSVVWDASLGLRASLTTSWAADLGTRVSKTVGLDADLGLRTTKTVNWDTAPIGWSSIVVQWNADLGARLNKTVALDTNLGLRATKTVGWDAVIGVVIVLVPPTDAEVADSLAGRYGPVRLRYRYEKRDHQFNFEADLTEAVEACTVTLQNKQAITRTASFSLRTERLGDFDPLEDHIAVWADLIVRSQAVSFNLGLFHLDEINDQLSPNSNEVWEASAADVSIHLWENSVDAPYTILQGTRYTDAVTGLIQQNGLVALVPASAKVTPVAFTWPIGTSHGQIINDLLDGINFYPAWADGRGRILSRLRTNPARTTAAVAYTTEAEPHMIRPNFGRHYSRARYLNQVVMTIKDPSRAPAAVRITNADIVSPVSTIRKGATTSAQASADRIVDTATIADVGSWMVWDAAILAQVAALVTHPDPRREAHEFYDVTVEGQEVLTHWRVEGWSLPCITGASQTHNIGRASDVLLLTETL